MYKKIWYMLSIKSHRNVLKRFFKHLIFLFIAIGFISITSHYAVKNLNLNKLKFQEQQILATIHEINHFESIISDVTFLSKHFEHIESDNFIEEPFIKQLELIFSNFLNSKKIYSQVRFIDNTGQEKVRIDKLSDKSTVVITGSELQNKSNRYYFKDAFKLSKGEIHISPFDLNIENGKVEYPPKPMIRIGTPVYNIKGDKTGIIIVNYNGQILFDILRNISRLSNGSFYLLNKNGYYLIGNTPEEEWGFMYEQRKNISFGLNYNEEWQDINTQKEGSILSSSGLFTFTTIYPLPSETISSEYNLNSDVSKYLKPNEVYWKIITYIPSSKIKLQLKKTNQTWQFILLIASLIVMVLLYQIARSTEHKKQASETIKENLGRLKKQANTIDKQKVYLEKQNKTLKKHQEDLDEVIATKDKLLALIAHDLYSHFSNIQGFSKLLISELDDFSVSELKNHIETIEISAHQGHDLLQNLSEWSRMHTGLLKYTPTNCNLQDIVFENIKLLKVTAAKKNIELTSLIQKNHSVYVERKTINTVFRNIISNAIKYSYPGSEIIITSILKNNEITVCIADAGKGIPKEKLPNLFKIEQNSSTPGTENELGSGLGLIICKEFIELNKGKIWVESSVGKGSKFYFTLPVYSS